MYPGILTLLAIVGMLVVPCQAGDDWKLIWSDEFNGSAVDTEKWSRCKRKGADWANTKSDDSRLVRVRHGVLRLWGAKNPDTSKDPVPFFTAGLESKGKFSFKYGKIQIRAKFKSAQGAWPALWMLGEKGSWPKNGEIDLMEHLNFDDKIYQTVHSPYTRSVSSKLPISGSTSPIDKGVWNTYGCEWYADKIVFTVNGQPTHTYPRVVEKGDDQWPFQQPFYIIMSMQIGGKWVNANGKLPTKPEHYPVWMDVDWVRVYQKQGS